MADLTNTQKKEWARTLYLRENLTQQEIADRVGCSRVTVSNWCRAGKWEEQKVGIMLTRREQAQSLYRQLAEIDKAIMTKPEGERFPDTKLADTIAKLTAPYTTSSRRWASPTASPCSPTSSNGCDHPTSRRPRNSRRSSTLT